ncbi:MAG: cation:proton antiporter regulatory subunit [Bacillota bacterium]
MQIKSVDLPGVGRKYTIETGEGCLLVIIIHHNGHRELYTMCHVDDDEPRFALEMNDETARKVGAILMGADYQPVADERVEIMRKNILVEWIRVEPQSSLSNLSIKDSHVRSVTGATIIGIQRGVEVIGSPDISEVIRPGDVLMAIGKKEQIKALEALCRGEGR